jgi:hypothetical protein
MEGFLVMQFTAEGWKVQLQKSPKAFITLVQTTLNREKASGVGYKYGLNITAVMV